MKFQIIFTMTIFLVVQVAIAQEKDNHSKHSQHKATEHSQLKLNVGKKWETDSPLRTGMENIKSNLESKLPDIHHNKFTKDQFAELSQKISSDLDSIFKNCKLTPEADEQLHLILVEIMDGADKMKKVKPDDRKIGAIKVFKALDQYPKYFAHPNWKAIQH